MCSGIGHCEFCDFEPSTAKPKSVIDPANFYFTSSTSTPIVTSQSNRKLDFKFFRFQEKKNGVSSFGTLVVKTAKEMILSDSLFLPN